MPTPLRVLVDGRALTDASAFRGIGTYVRQVVDGLARHPDVELTVLARRSAVLPQGARRLAAFRVAPGRFQDREHELLLPLDLRRRSVDVVLSPALDAPRSCPVPWVQTLHDAWPAVHEDSGADAAAWRRQAARFTGAAAVITVSRWSAEGAVRLLGIDPGRLHVIPHGVSPAFRPGSGPADPPYLLFVGEYDPRKRHDHAFAAVAALAERGHPHHLRVTGRIAPWYADLMASLVAASPRPDLVELLGHVSFEELVRLYQGASALLVTSEGEGFGLPALEAMASGTPVVAYDNSATGEVVGGAGVLVPDGDLAALVKGVDALLVDPQHREELVARGLERAGGLTWEASVDAHVAVLRAAAWS
jgi:glycosyltransferase involved in cell wall biosynthesis